MITHIKINGFKSFYDFAMEFTPLTIIAGTNASGKSNLFDALLLLSRMAETDLRTAFSEQRGNPIELFTQIENGVYVEDMEFVVEMLVNRKVRDNWGGEVDIKNTRLRYTIAISRKQNPMGFEDLIIKKEILEKIRPEDDKWIKRFPRAKNLFKGLSAGGSKEPFIQTLDEHNVPTIKIRQDGGGGGKATPANTISQTVLGGVVNVDFPHVFAVKEEMRNWHFLQVNPEDLRLPTKQEPGMKDIITASGKNMAAALYRLYKNDEYIITEISRRLNSFIPTFVEVKIENDEGSKHFVIKLKDKDGKEFSSRVLSEGTLRLLLLCILEHDNKHNGLLCFEEPENGINPYRIKALTNLLKGLTVNFEEELDSLRQVIVNTHSPVVIGETLQWKNDKHVSVHYAEMVKRSSKLHGKAILIGITKILPVALSDENQLSMEFSEQERKMSIASIRGYLETSNFSLDQ